MNFQLISAIIRGIWAIDSEVAESYYPSIHSLLNGADVNFEFDDFKPVLHLENKSIPFDSEKVAPQANEGAVLEIPLHGPLMKNDQMCGPVGMNSIGQMLKQADNDPNIKGIVLNIDSPGGSAQGTPQLAQIIKNTIKPVVGYIDGMGASAAYWLASATDKIVAERKSQVGSIGTMLSFADIQPALELQGVKFHNITSDQSPDKNKMYREIQKGNYADFKKEVLNPITDDFINGVKSNRSKIEASQLTGKTFFSENVLNTMVDEIGSMEDALRLIDELANDQTTKQPIQNSNTMEIQNINSTLGTELEVTEEGVFLNQEQLEALNAALEPAPAQPAQQNPEPEPDPDPEPAAKADPEPEPNPLAAELQAALQHIDTLEAAPGAQTAKAVAKTDPGKSDGVKLVTKDDPTGENFLENIDKVREAYL